MILVKLEFLWFFVIFVFKAVLDKFIHVHLYQFCCIFRALWPVTSCATGAPMAFDQIPRALTSACAHGEVIVAPFHVFITLNGSVLYRFLHI